MDKFDSKNMILLCIDRQDRYYYYDTKYGDIYKIIFRYDLAVAIIYKLDKQFAVFIGKIQDSKGDISVLINHKALFDYKSSSRIAYDILMSEIENYIFSNV